jgi:hypothetical protein
VTKVTAFPFNRSRDNVGNPWTEGVLNRAHPWGFGSAARVASISANAAVAITLLVIMSVLFVAPATASSRGYLTTPQELAIIRQKAQRGIEPYRAAVADVMDWATRDWDFPLSAETTCEGARDPLWDNFQGGTPILYAKALAYHLTGDSHYAGQVKDILQRIMSQVKSISLDEQQCQLNFAWGTPELVASADLIDDYWKDTTCVGPTSTRYDDTRIGTGNCKVLFQNWLIKNPYYVFSQTTTRMMSNWGAAATNAAMYIADYVSDRPDVTLVHRNPKEVNGGHDYSFSPAESYRFIKAITLKRMSMYAVGFHRTSCDYLSGPQQSSQWLPVKSGITHTGIVTEDARRKEYCNIPRYDGLYQNYPEVHLGNQIQQCELMLRRGDSSCYDNIDMKDIPEYRFIGPDGVGRTTHLYAGRGSLERAIDAIIIDAGTPWKRAGALSVAYRYYLNHKQLQQTDLGRWARYLEDGSGRCFQDICFGTLTHGLARGEKPSPPPTVPPPGGSGD